MLTEPDENGEIFDDEEGDSPPVEFDPRTVPVRWSWLSKFKLSAKQARHAANRGSTDEGSLAMRLGTGVHAVTFGQPFAVSDLRRGTKDRKAFEIEHAATLGSAPIMSSKQYAHAKAMSDALHADPTAAPILFGEGVEHEKLIEWTRHGRRCRSRLDAVAPGLWIADLKTCRSAQPSRFIRAATWAGYPGQLCFYDEADAFHSGRLDDDGRVEHEIPLYIVAIESAPPYEIVTYPLDATAIDLGRKMIGQCWNALRVAEAENAWHGYTQSPWPFVVDSDDEAMGEIIERPGAA